MLQSATPFQVSLARSEAEIRAAQRLRYDVFVSEFGSDGDGVDHENRLETDAFDAHADHLLLRDTRLNDGATDRIVGVYRLMTQTQADRAGGFYSASEFDLTPLETSGLSLLELGRSCLHPDYRGGAALMALWRGVAEYVSDRGIELLFGTASFRGTDAAALQHPISDLHRRFLAPPDLRVTSRMKREIALLPAERIDRKSAMRDTPALIKSYLKLGGFIGQGVYVDHAFNSVDVCVILKASDLDPSLLLRPDRRAA